MGRTVYLRTNRFEVELEWIIFKAKHFEYLCTMDFLFPDGKVWDHPPVVGLDVMCHPRYPSLLLLLLCFGVGCVILKFQSGEALPAPIHRFLSDKRIHFVGFGIPEKKDMFPFEELGLTKNNMDIGYIASKILKDPKYKRWELAELARKVLGIKRMIGLAETSSFERHEQIKCAICQLFITSVIAMRLISASSKKKMDDSPKKSSFLKNLNMLPLLAEGWFKSPNGKKKSQRIESKEEHGYIYANKVETEDTFGSRVFIKTKYQEGTMDDYHVDAKIHEDDFGDAVFHVTLQRNSPDDDLDHVKFNKGNHPGDGFAFDEDKDGIWLDDSSKEISSAAKKPLKGILKCPSSNNLLLGCTTPSMPESPLSASKEPMMPGRDQLRRANSKGCNVSFTHH